jgi:predicted SAM-dependent methyltransferase
MRKLLRRIRGSTFDSATAERIGTLLARCEGRVHLGCNTVRVEGFVNVDVRSTSATDVVHDCRNVAIFPDKSINVLYSNAFFEHVYVNDRLPLLKDIHRALRADGSMLFTGIPDFEGIAQAYLEKRSPGNVSPTFDLYEAYRYTHGAPEGEPRWWLAQLHKGLFDAPTLQQLLKEAGFVRGSVFSYRWGNEPNGVTLGCVARASDRPAPTDLAEIRDLVGSLPSNINYGSLVIKTSF